MTILSAYVCERQGHSGLNERWLQQSAKEVSSDGDLWAIHAPQNPGEIRLVQKVGETSRRSLQGDRHLLETKLGRLASDYKARVSNMNARQTEFDNRKAIHDRDGTELAPSVCEIYKKDIKSLSLAVARAKRLMDQTAERLEKVNVALENSSEIIHIFNIDNLVFLVGTASDDDLEGDQDSE